MGCFPAGYKAIEYHRAHQYLEMRHDSRNFSDAIGGRFVNYPLTPQNVLLTAQQSAELEIRRAMRAGIDGFAVDAWAGGDGAKEVFDQLIKAAQRLGVPFYLTICMDASCHRKMDNSPAGSYVDEYAASIRELLDQYGQSPNLARRNGKPLIFGYHSRSAYRTLESAALPEGPQKWKQVVDAYREIEKKVGQPLFFHFCFDTFLPDQTVAENEELVVDSVRYIGQNFGAVGGFLGGPWSESAAVVEAIRESGAEWSQPMFPQYNNKTYKVVSDNGLNLLRRNWEAAIANGATLLQFVTWNDYGEDTILAPGYSTNYTISSVNAYYSRLWKTGRTDVQNDELHLIFRRLTNEASDNPESSYPFPTRSRTSGQLEVLTMLKEPGSVELQPHGERFDVPAGLSFKQFPLKAGAISARLVRNGKAVLDLTPPERITDKPFREDASMVAFSSNFDALWQADFPKSAFPDAKKLLYSEYGDLDNDGLPNWFEMYWFGQFPNMETACAADPKADPAADPDADGISNLDEYRNQTNPLVANQPYRLGCIWTLDAIHDRGLSFNPDRDFNDSPVWYYLYRLGERLNTPHDGRYERCPSFGPDVPYAGKMAHFSPVRADGYQQTYGWIARKKTATGGWELMFKPRLNAILILGWKSPIDGTVSMDAEVLPVAGQDGITLEIARETTSLYEKQFDPGQTSVEKISIPAVAVRKGDFLYFIVDEKPGYDGSTLNMTNLKIRYESN